MNFEEVESAVIKLSKNIKKDSFVYDFLRAFGTAKATITMLKNGSRNLSKNENEVICKKKIYFVFVEENVEKFFKELISRNDTFKHDPRFVIATDYEELFAFDVHQDEKIDFKIGELHKKFDFFLPLAGIEKKEFQHENPVDVKAAEKLAKLFDLIKLDNPKNDSESLHSLNVFLTRLLFCYFAEDTEIFPSNVFTTSIASHTQEDGSDLSSYLKKLFAIMNVEERPRELPDYILDFPYVNGGLFAEKHDVPKFSKKSREALLDLGELDWAEINPDIFGSMIQAVVHPDQRAGLGMHYTSVSNIIKVIEPLFITELYEEFEKSKKSEAKLKRLLKRISEIQIFDPACGSGNFLIIAYKELRKLEMKIYSYLPNELKFSYIPLSNFFGIEIDDFAHEVAILSLWLAEHQMDVLFTEEFGEVKASLPLKDGGNILNENSLRVDWSKFCPNETKETYLIGNPPYLGFKGWNTEQKEDMDLIFSDLGNVKRLDYIGCFFKKGADYIAGKKSKLSFVSTNSITQGEQVSLLWPYVFQSGVEMKFAHSSFKWTNNAKKKAGVTVVIIGLANVSNEKKYIFTDGLSKSVKNITPYLTTGKHVYFSQRQESIANLPEMALGSSGIDGGHLILSKSDKEQFILNNEGTKKYIKKFIGGNDFLKAKERYCLWIGDNEVEDASSYPDIKDRIEKCRIYREGGGRDAKKAASVPHRFFYRKFKKGTPIILPFTSSENRDYLPVGYESDGTIISNGLFVIYESDPFIFSILCSRLHWVWTQAISGKLETRVRYSVNLVYNNLPVPELTEEIKNELRASAFKIIEVREKFSDKNLSFLYDPEKMPEELKKVHYENDQIVERIYRKKKFVSDEEILEHLFNEYLKMTGSNNE